MSQRGPRGAEVRWEAEPGSLRRSRRAPLPAPRLRGRAGRVRAGVGSPPPRDRRPLLRLGPRVAVLRATPRARVGPRARVALRRMGGLAASRRGPAPGRAGRARIGSSTRGVRSRVAAGALDRRCSCSAGRGADRDHVGLPCLRLPDDGPIVRRGRPAACLRDDRRAAARARGRARRPQPGVGGRADGRCCADREAGRARRRGPHEQHGGSPGVQRRPPGGSWPTSGRDRTATVAGAQAQAQESASIWRTDCATPAPSSPRSARMVSTLPWGM